LVLVTLAVIGTLRRSSGTPHPGLFSSCGCALAARNGKRWTPLEHAVDDNALLLPTDLPVMQSSKFELFSSTDAYRASCGRRKT
jgi:hypothetical protein